MGSVEQLVNKREPTNNQYAHLVPGVRSCEVAL